MTDASKLKWIPFFEPGTGYITWDDDLGENTIELDGDSIEVEHNVEDSMYYTHTVRVYIPVDAVIALLENEGYSVVRRVPET